ncbi:unnamed protein product [Cylicocyclus nassatus]|uniref:Uncharacterized protein n=1 Tax=Cylicocyclus nassatus TaxID=53992 RepID=A0AA36HF74_CYLNA|nr:unnamed protein product [Cylicocyclus nassatus]
MDRCAAACATLTPVHEIAVERAEIVPGCRASSLHSTVSSEPQRMSSPGSSHSSVYSQTVIYVPCAPDVCWNRLRTVVLAIRSTREILEEQRRQLQEGGHLYHLVKAHKYVHEIQNLRIAISRRHKAVEHLKRICTKKRLSVVKANEDVEEKKAQEDLREGLLTLRMHCDSGTSTLDSRIKVLNVFTHATVMRRRVLLIEVSDILHMVVRLISSNDDDDDDCLSIHESESSLMDLISSHESVEVSSALGHVVHFLLSISQLLDYTLRYPLQSCASTSSIYCPKKNKSLPLYWTRWRSGRENFENAVSLLGKNIAQIQEDNGFSLARLSIV